MKGSEEVVRKAEAEMKVALDDMNAQVCSCSALHLSLFFSFGFGDKMSHKRYRILPTYTDRNASKKNVSSVFSFQLAMFSHFNYVLASRCLFSCLFCRDMRWLSLILTGESVPRSMRGSGGEEQRSICRSGDAQ